MNADPSTLDVACFVHYGIAAMPAILEVPEFRQVAVSSAVLDRENAARYALFA
jgi:hypothetical protein